MDILHFWGKARPHLPHGPRWHPLAFHCLDVAAVGDALLSRNRGLAQSLSDLLGVPPESTCLLLRRLLCLHDIGKFAKRFQAKEPRLYRNCFPDDPASLSAAYDHGAGGLLLFNAAPGLFHLSGASSLRAWRPLVSAVMGHHGAPPEPGFNDTTLRREFGTVGIEAARAFAQQTKELFAAAEDLSVLERRRVTPASYAVAGFAVLADWIGSNQEWFPYCAPSSDLGAYWRNTQQRAARAVDEAGVSPAEVRRSVLDYVDLIGTGVTPSPMQEWARTVELPAGPGLFLIEDETGSGKTEAALMLAHRLLACGHADGLYVALPTMATANAMFDRLAAAYRHLFTAGAVPSIALAHGARDMHAGFRAAMSRGGRREAPYSDVGMEEDPSATTASAACSAWIADDRRRAFLADAGAGTIDQALLSVLPSRHQSLRLLGLMRRVLILDEVHAYDAYMQRELEELLEFQAGLGGSAILLSATLPVVIRRRLAAGFAKGATSNWVESVASSDVGAMDYPLATMCTAEERSSMAVLGQYGRARTLPVRFLRSPDEAALEVERAARAGKAVLYLRNTVDDALDSYSTLKARGLDPLLFHARFALVDRLEIERRVVKRFGKYSKPAERARQVLVATQVVEQSLDLDFDVLITDLAPIDLVIQRAGRLWRHQREDRGGQPELVVVGPEPVADATEDWFRKTFPRAAYVYRDHARLWLSARTLQDAGVIDSPRGLRTLIESVYGNDAGARLPPALQGSLRTAGDRAGAERGVANINTLKLAKGYLRDGGSWDSDVRTPTRLEDEPHVTLRLACVNDGRIMPYAREGAPPDAPRAAWRVSEVNVSARRVGAEDLPPNRREAALRAKQDWTRFDQEKILLVLEPAAGDARLVGRALAGGKAPTPIRVGYDPQIGLTWL